MATILGGNCRDASPREGSPPELALADSTSQTHCSGRCPPRPRVCACAGRSAPPPSRAPSSAAAAHAWLVSGSRACPWGGLAPRRGFGPLSLFRVVCSAPFIWCSSGGGAWWVSESLSKSGDLVVRSVGLAPVGAASCQRASASQLWTARLTVG